MLPGVRGVLVDFGQAEELGLEGRAIFGGVEGYGGLLVVAGAFLSLRGLLL